MLKFSAWLLAGLMLGSAPLALAKSGTKSSGLTQGCDGTVNQSLELSNGDLLVAGSFTACGGVASPGIARFNGKRWFALGPGLRGEVFALAQWGTDIYAGGFFDRAGDLSVDSIARFDGERWHRLGSAAQNGVDYQVTGLEMFEGKLFVVGIFSRTGALSNSTGLAMWDGSDWRLPPWEGFTGGVADISVANGALYVSGIFSVAGLNAPTLVLRGGTWSHVPRSEDGAQRPSGALKIVSDERSLYAINTGVMCGIVCNAPVYRFGFGVNVWSVHAILQGWIHDLALINGEIFASGDFTIGNPLLGQNQYLARRRGNTWEYLTPKGIGPIGPTGFMITSLGTHRGLLVVTGSFTHIGSRRVNRIAYFDGNKFSPLGSEPDTSVEIVDVATPSTRLTIGISSE